LTNKLGRSYLAPVIALAVSVMTPHVAYADAEADKAAIMDRFHGWTAAFNAKDAAGVCDLFAPDLIYSLPEVVNGSQQTICDNLAKMLARQDIQLHYDDPDVHEIIVSGDMAVVRLKWTLTVEAKGQKETTTEEGIDIFRRQADGRWSIARFIAFTTKPNELLR
jgi:steroid delta-isomerase